MEEKLDMRISGSSTMPGGEYRSVRISGSGHMSGPVRCVDLHASGSARLNSVDCERGIHVSGSARFEGDVTAQELSVSGACRMDGGARIKEDFTASGAVRVGKDVSCMLFRCSGSASVEGDIEAERADISGSLICRGLLNAEEVDIRLGGRVELGSIGGSRIRIRPGSFSSGTIRIFGISIGRGRGRDRAEVQNAIEGDDICIENVICPRVSGRKVTVGAGCKIDLVQYSESLEIEQGARVERQEKL